MSNQFNQHYNLCIETFEDIEQMFAWLDLYRKTKDKRNLYAAKDYETRIRKNLPTIKAQNQILITEKTIAA